MTKSMLTRVLIAACLLPQIALSADYVIDTTGQHAFVTFKASHLGFSYIIGHFDSFEGRFSHDTGSPGNSNVKVTIETKSLDTNHAERDKHLKSAEYLDADKYPVITFESTSFSGDAKAGKLTGDLSFHGLTRSVVLDVVQIGEGKDPWGGYRSGFQGNVTLSAEDFNLPGWIGDVEVELIVEGVRQ